MEHKSGWDLTEWDLAEGIYIGKHWRLGYPSGISRFQAIIILCLGEFDALEGSKREVQPDGELFKSYATILIRHD